STRRDFAVLFHRFFVVEKSVAHFLDGQALCLFARRPSGVKVILLCEVAGERAIGIVPLTEVVDFAANLLCPYARCMGVERKIGIGLVRLEGAARMSFGHGNIS